MENGVGIMFSKMFMWNGHSKYLSGGFTSGVTGHVLICHKNTCTYIYNTLWRHPSTQQIIFAPLILLNPICGLLDPD